jgi:hypothetical protein
MICDKCDPAGHIGGEEREFLKRMHEERLKDLGTLNGIIGEMLAGKRPPDRFTGDRIAGVLRDLDAISNLQIVIGLEL